MEKMAPMQPENQNKPIGAEQEKILEGQQINVWVSACESNSSNMQKAEAMEVVVTGGGSVSQ